MSVFVVNKINTLREYVNSYKKEGLTVGLVPTMGALHAGHASLIKKAKETCDKVIVSVFVNPVQFGPGEDFDKYPRTLDNDKKICDELAADIIFAPSVDEMYGENTLLSNTDMFFVCPPYKFIDCMCGKSRPGHFDGVSTVVLKLFNIVSPDFAFFGQKDAQQLFIIKKMVKDLNLNVNIISCPIVRDIDGLALSSRNAYLSSEERNAALSISKALFCIQKTFASGINDTSVLFDTAISVLNKSLEIEYIEFRNFENFLKVDKICNTTLVAIAAKSGNTRLIDNIIINVG